MYNSSFTIIVLHLQLSGQLEQILKDVLFSDSSNMFEAIQSNSSYNYIANSTITGNVAITRTSNLLWNVCK
jgi:hypothetical protein